jgi:hypothetical protein
VSRGEHDQSVRRHATQRSLNLGQQLSGILLKHEVLFLLVHLAGVVGHMVTEASVLTLFLGFSQRAQAYQLFFQSCSLGL